MKKKRESIPFNFSSPSGQYIISILMVGATALLCSLLSSFQGYHVVSFIFLFVLSLQATFLGIGPVFVSATLSSLIWNFFFIPPNYTFHIDKAEDILMFGMFFIIAILNGVLTTRVRRQEQLALNREERTNALFQLTRELSFAGNIDEVLAIASSEIRNNFNLEPIILLQDGNNILKSDTGLHEDKGLSKKDFERADWAYKNGVASGAFTANFPDSDYMFYPLPGKRLNPGVVALRIDGPFSGDQMAFRETFIAQISNALEREFLGEIAQKARFLAESDRLYKTLFNSISHELRIPIATIMGASDALLSAPHPANILTALYSEIFTASLRLNRLIENLLNISRLESGLLSVRLDWHDITDLVNKVSGDLKDELKPYTFVVTIQENMPLVRIDFGLMEQILYNLLINSSQYAPVASEIELNISYEVKELIVQVKDRGPGFPEAEINKVFRKFYRVNGRKTGGLGLGLSIVRGFVEAHNGNISVANRAEGGTCFTIHIPSDDSELNNFKFDNE